MIKVLEEITLDSKIDKGIKWAIQLVKTEGGKKELMFGYYKEGEKGFNKPFTPTVDEFKELLAKHGDSKIVKDYLKSATDLFDKP
ncbi:hypothetical protein DRO69_09360 [Candidatus Bathyarchaeota archaeon]|nr:MAG: hypothetical protein DRO69_09360 [Candidatus Bathyarchaeota archaeon]